MKRYEYVVFNPIYEKIETVLNRLDKPTNLRLVQIFQYTGSDHILVFEYEEQEEPVEKKDETTEGNIMYMPDHKSLSYRKFYRFNGPFYLIPEGKE
jgi:hypothetical protein